jgi:hypothetical protein
VRKSILTEFPEGNRFRSEILREFDAFKFLGVAFGQKHLGCAARARLLGAQAAFGIRPANPPDTAALYFS